MTQGEGMLPTSFHYKRFFSTVSLLILFFNTWPAYAADTATVNVISASDMLKNIATQLPAVLYMVKAFAYVMGTYFIFYGILKLKQYGEARTQMSSEHSLKGPLIFLVIGALLIYFPASVQVGLSTFWENPSPFGYLEETGQWQDLMKNVFLVVQIFGTIAFIRGLVILSHLSGHGQPGNFAKGVTHVIGGLFCINIYQFVQVVLVTLGM